MKRTLCLLFVLLCLYTPLRAQNETVIPRGSKVFIEPMDGFETYLMAAFEKKQTPLLVVADKDKADFVISGSSDRKDAGWAKTIFGGGRPHIMASIKVVNAKTSVLAYAVASDKGNAVRGYKSAAEHLAKNLRQKIEKDEKPKK
jgi:hypothetical protein